MSILYLSSEFRDTHLQTNPLQASQLPRVQNQLAIVVVAGEEAEDHIQCPEELGLTPTVRLGGCRGTHAIRAGNSPLFFNATPNHFPCKYNRIQLYFSTMCVHIHIHIYIYTYIYISLYIFIYYVFAEVDMPEFEAISVKELSMPQKFGPISSGSLWPFELRHTLCLFELPSGKLT